MTETTEYDRGVLKFYAEHMCDIGRQAAYMRAPAPSTEIERLTRFLLRLPSAKPEHEQKIRVFLTQAAHSGYEHGSENLGYVRSDLAETFLSGASNAEIEADAAAFQGDIPDYTMGQILRDLNRTHRKQVPQNHSHQRRRRA